MEALSASALIAPVAAPGESAADSRLAPAGADSLLDFVGTVQEDGTTALLAFADSGALSRWSPEHAFVAVKAPDLCALVLDRGLHALDIDPAGPVRLTLGPETLRRCALARTAPSSSGGTR